MLLIGLISLAKLDTPIIPIWILKRIMWLDFPNGSYFGAILMHHTHNNPIANTFKHFLSKNFLVIINDILVQGLDEPEPQEGDQDIQILEKSDIIRINKLKRIARRFRVCLLLNKNP